MSKLQNRKPNCSYYTVDLWNSEAREMWKEKILKSPLIFLDIDPHEGIMEYEFYMWLREINYKGLLLLDDIWYFKGMRDHLWYRIMDTKWDLTDLGHWSGSGLVDFSQQVKGSDMEIRNTLEDKWTCVTAYFDLTKEPDASDAIRARPLDHYLKEAHTTLCLPQHLVVYCDETTYPLLEKMRPSHLKAKTRYILKPFSSFVLEDKKSNGIQMDDISGGTNQFYSIPHLRAKIDQNRIDHPYQFDARNTASYYLFCMLRYVMLNEVMDANPFQSSHFAWVNLNIENYGWHNAASFESVFRLHRDKFSTCWIDYIPPSLVQNTEEYFQYGRCGMCSGFFTGNEHYFREFNNYILETFFDCLHQGFGHADEQLYSIVYYQHPDIFEPYFGDYTEMVTNYVTVKRRATEPVKNIIQHSFDFKDYVVCKKACESVLPAKSTLPPEVLEQLLSIYSQVKDK
jgi:hypothetical protein